MAITIQGDIGKIQSAGLLDKLFSDKTTGKNVMRAADAYRG